MAGPPYTRRGFLALSAGTVAGAALSGCSVPVIGGGPDRAGKRKLIGVSLEDSSPFARCLASGVLAALRGSGYAAVFLPARLSANQELANLQSLLVRRAAGLVVLPVGVPSTSRAAYLAQGGGVPLSACLLPRGGLADTYLAGVVDPGSQAGGQLLGRWVVEHVPGGGEVIVVQGLPGQGVSELLDRGLDSALAPGGRFRVVARGPGGLEAAGAVQVVRAALADHPRARVVVTHSAGMGAAVASFLRDSGRRDIVHVTSDADADTLRWLRTPYLRATRFYSAAQVGRQAAEIVLDALRHDRAQSEPFRRTVAQSMRTAADFAAAGPFCDAATLGEVTLGHPAPLPGVPVAPGVAPSGAG